MQASSTQSHSQAASPSRRQVLKMGAVAGGAVLTTSPIFHAAYAGESNTIRLALIGCGGRGSGAAGDAMQTQEGPVKLHAMADIVESRINLSHTALTSRFGEQVDVPPERRFLGFDAYRHAIDTLRPGDIALCTTHAYARADHVEYAVSKGVHVFMEKSFAPDPGGLKRILAACEEAERKNLKVAAGLQCRHSVNRKMLIDRINNGDLGPVQLVRAYRMDGGTRLGRRDPNRIPTELQYQILRPYVFPWVSGGLMIELLIHQIDECCWLMNDWPVEAHGLGGVEPYREDCGQSWAAYAMEYTFPNGTKALVNYRGMPGCKNDFVTYVNGTKRAAQFSGNIHAGDVHMYNDLRCTPNNIAWKAPDEQFSPWQAQWNVIMRKIRRDEPLNEGPRAVRANYAALMGRAAVHTGQVVTWDQITQSDFRFVDKSITSWDDEPPYREDEHGRYPLPVPGKWQEL